MIEYKGYFCGYVFDWDVKKIYLEAINTKDVICSQCESKYHIGREFIAVIDSHLAFCESKGIKASSPRELSDIDQIAIEMMSKNLDESLAECGV